MSIARQFFNEFKPLFRMLEEPVTRSPWSYGIRHRSLFDDPFFNSPSFSRPAVDVTEEGNKYVVEADLPGVKKENIEVRIGDAGRSVTIEGKIVQRQRENAVKEHNSDAANTSAEGTSNQISAERPSTYNATFSRTVWLPRPVDSSNVVAQLSDGVLTITVPMAKDKASVAIPVQ